LFVDHQHIEARPRELPRAGGAGGAAVDEATTSQILRTADAAAQAGVKIEVRDYLAA
jgi:hypothetical protein